jgi:ribose transport system permease protein
MTDNRSQKTEACPERNRRVRRQKSEFFSLFSVLCSLSSVLNTIGPLLGLVFVYVIFAIVSPPSFTTVRNLEMILRQTTIVGVAALGMTLVMISGGIDLSVGSIVALGTVVIAWLLQYGGAGPLTAALGGMAVAACFGLLSGLLITRLRVVPFIVTLGMMLVVRGTAKGIGHEQKINVDIERMAWLDKLLATLPQERSWVLVPPGVWLLLFLSIAMAALLRYTRLGRHTFAIGSNEQTARLCGVPVERVKVLVYTICAAFAGLAGLMQFSRLTVGDPTVAVGLELNVIAAVVIGGGSLSGGEGSILGTLVGALIMTVIASGCTQMGLPNWVQEIITGVIIVVAVALDRLRHRHAT